MGSSATPQPSLGHATEHTRQEHAPPPEGGGGCRPSGTGHSGWRHLRPSGSGPTRRDGRSPQAPPAPRPKGHAQGCTEQHGMGMQGWKSHKPLTCSPSINYRCAFNP